MSGFDDVNYAITIKKKRVTFVLSASLTGIFDRLLIDIRPVERICKNLRSFRGETFIIF
jgi:hypothetical protein